MTLYRDPLWDFLKSFTLPASQASVFILFTVVVRVCLLKSALSSIFIVLGPLWWPCVSLCLAFNRSQVLPAVCLLANTHTCVSILFSIGLSTFALTAWGGVSSWVCFGAYVHQISNILVQLHSSWPALWSGLRHSCLLLSICACVVQFHVP